MTADTFKLFDHPLVNHRIFFPRADYGAPPPTGAVDLTVSVAQGASVSVRCHLAPTAPTALLHFHGNGEVVSDYDDLAMVFQELGASPIFSDYRGYGKSSGAPTTSRLLDDAHRVLDAVLEHLAREGVNGPMIIMGRSLGSAPAIELASRREEIAGLIVESGFASTPDLLRTLGVPVDQLDVPTDSPSLDNQDKMTRVTCPALVLHAEHDQIIPSWHAKKNYERLPEDQRTLVMIPGAGHNDIMMFDRYWPAIGGFLSSLSRARADC